MLIAWLKRHFFRPPPPTGNDSINRSSNATLGAKGEEAAAQHLRSLGYRILIQNWRNPRDSREEIDLICRAPAGPGDAAAVLVFVEVKARVAGARVRGYSAVNKKKKSVLLRACRAYLASLRPPARHYRFDIIEVSHGGGPEAAAAFERLNLPPTVATQQAGRQVFHFPGVPLFPEHSSHRHGEHR